MNNPPTDLGIPLLTEIIGAQATPERVTAAVPASPAPAASTAPAPTPAAPPAREPLQFTAAPPAAAATPLPVVAPAVPVVPAVPVIPAVTSPTFAPKTAPAAQADNPWSDASLGELESELRERITRQVLGRIDFVLDHRVRNSLTDVVDHAIDSLAAEIKRGLHETLNDIVARAVAQEVSRLQSTKNK